MYDIELQTLQQAKKVRAACIINELSYVHKLHDYPVYEFTRVLTDTCTLSICSTVSRVLEFLVGTLVQWVVALHGMDKIEFKRSRH